MKEKIKGEKLKEIKGGKKTRKTEILREKRGGDRERQHNPFVTS